MPLPRRKFIQQSALVAASLTAPQFLSRLSAADAPAPVSNTTAAASNTTTAAAPAAPPAIVYPPAPTPIVAPDGFGVAPGPFQPTWDSLSSYQAPDWFRDAKLGIWAHWGPQCQPEMGDWYAQKMYQEGSADYKFHVQKYGHPSKFGFKDVINEWKAEKWDPEHLISLYKNAGAKYFTAMANHHDNFDMFNSKYQPWNSVAIGPKQDIVNGWKKAARNAGLRFGVTCHGDRAWSWYQAAQGADKKGPLAGVHYDGLMTKADGKGLWWDGLDPQDLYAQYHPVGNYDWPQNARQGAVPLDKAFTEKFFNRIIDLINQTDPDLVYFDDTILPIYPSTDIGLRIAAYLYNTNLARHGKLEAVMTGKGLDAQQQKCLVLDVERGVTNGIQAQPWQTDTCIGAWHYERSLLDQHKYKTAESVARMLLDIVSKNGCLQLNIPLPGNGLPDADELKFLAEFTTWMQVNSEGIYSSRPWKVYGEGPSVSGSQQRGQFGGLRDVRSYTPQDIRFMQKGPTLYAYALGWPTDGKLNITSLAAGAPNANSQIARVDLLGFAEPIKFTRDATGLNLTLPEQKVGDYAYGFKISGDGLTI